MTMPPQIIQIICYNCRKTIRPFGNTLMNVPAYVKTTCPHCKSENTVIYDEELRREVARRELNLDGQLGVKELESEYRILKAEVESSNKRIEGMDKEIQSIKEAIGSLIPAVRKQVADAIANMLQQPQSKENPLAR
jgi:flagellar motility protein MotE (MotC chaperone)